VRSVKHGPIAGPDPWKANTLEWFHDVAAAGQQLRRRPRIRSVEPMKDIRRQVERQTSPEAVPAPVAESAVRA